VGQFAIREKVFADCNKCRDICPENSTAFLVPASLIFTTTLCSGEQNQNLLAQKERFALVLGPNRDQKNLANLGPTKFRKSLVVRGSLHWSILVHYADFRNSTMTLHNFDSLKFHDPIFTKLNVNQNISPWKIQSRSKKITSSTFHKWWSVGTPEIRLNP